MNTIFKATKSVLILTAITICLCGVHAEERITQNFNFGWKFQLGDVENGEAEDLDVTGWQNIDLPHDFQIAQPWVTPMSDEKGANETANNTRSRLSARGFKEMGKGWYRKAFVADTALEGKRVIIEFGGIMLVGDVYLNGEHIGGTNYGYLGFEIDISKLLKYGETNVVAVKASTQHPKNSRWYTGGGLFRGVALIVKDPTSAFARHGIYITTPVINADSAKITLQAEVENNTRKRLYGQVHVAIYDPQNNLVGQSTSTLKMEGQFKRKEYLLNGISIAKPQLWSCETPQLYRAEFTLKNTKEDKVFYDKVTQKFGIRTVEYSPEFGCKLNGKKVLLKGIANHHSLGALGAAAYPRAIEKRFQMLKSFGLNHIRCSHNPYSKEFYELADQYGILIVDELFDKWSKNYTGNRVPFMELWPNAVPEFVKSTRNHPSVIMWSLGNELQMWWNNAYYDWGVTPYKLMDILVKRYDKTRPTTVAMFPRRRYGNSNLPPELAVETEIASYNYLYKNFKGDRETFPDMIFYQSEASVNDMGPNFFEMDLDKVIGLAYWGGIDYLGESKGWPAKGWNSGVFDMSLEPKPQAYLMKSIYSNEPTVHIGIINDSMGDTQEVWNDVKVGVLPLVDHWNFEDEKTVNIYTYTNAETVELILNGRSLGIKRNAISDPAKRNKIYWENIPYTAGNLVAIAKTAEKEVARHTLETTGKVVALKLEADNSSWQANGLDLQHIMVYGVDAKGRKVNTAVNKIAFEIEGDATIVGTDNGDITSDELHTAKSRRLHNGSAMVIVRAGQQQGKITIKASSEGLKPTKLKTKTL